MKMMLKAALLVAVIGVATLASGCCGPKGCFDCCIDCNDYYAPSPVDVLPQ